MGETASTAPDGVEGPDFVEGLDGVEGEDGASEARALAGLGAESVGPIDIGYLDWYTAGDQAVRGEILALFHGQAAQWLSQFSPDLPDEEWHLLAHSLKGSARGIGAFGLADLAETAEGLTGGDTQEARKAILAQLAAAIGDVQSAIDRMAA